MTASAPPPPSSARAGVFVLLLLLSGFCGISYEVLYGRMLSNFIGDQFAVNASILLTFMLGIGFGTWTAHRWWRWLWLIEGLIGVCGAGFALGAGALEQWFYTARPWGGSLAGAMALCSVVLCAPAFLIGCSVPLFAGCLKRLQGGRVFARAYAIYNLGAALTVLVIEFWLLRQVGIRHTVLLMAGLNAVISFTLWFGFRELRTAPGLGATAREPFPLRVITALIAASVASAIFQLLMVKLAESFLGPYRETFALVLTVVLFGLAAGSALTRRARLSFAGAVIMSLAGLAWLLGGFDLVTRTYAGLYPAAVEHTLTTMLLKAGAVSALMLVPATGFGATVPALLGELGSVARDSGRLLSISSLANAVGFLLMAFVLHRHLDYGVLVLVIAGLSAAALMLWGQFRPVMLAGALALFALPLGLHRLRWEERRLYFGYDFYQSSRDLRQAGARLKTMEWFKGHQDVFSLNRLGEDDLFFVNGYISNSLQAPAEKIVSAFPALFAPRTDRALVLGVGSGATAGAAALLFDHVDAVEINPVVLANLHRMAEHNFDLARRPRVHFILDDGIHYIRTNAQQYPLIVNTVTSPRYFSSAKLYTRDFFEAVRARLSPDGLYVAWIDGSIGNRGLDIILKTVAQSFPECAVGGLSYGYFLLVCSQEPLQLRRPDLVVKEPTLAAYFQRSGLPPAGLPYALLTTRAFDLISDTNAPLNTLDFPALEFEMSRVGDRPVTRFTERLEQRMSLENMAAALQPALKFDPIQFALTSEMLFERSTLGAHAVKLASEAVEDFTGPYREAKLNHVAAAAGAAQTPKAFHRYGAELLAQRRYRDAIEQEQKALTLNPARLESWETIGTAHEKLGEWNEALTAYERELERQPEGAPALFGLGRVYYKIKRPADALRFLDRSRAAEDRPEVHYYIGLALEALGRTNEAKVEFDRGLRTGTP